MNLFINVNEETLWIFQHNHCFARCFELIFVHIKVGVLEHDRPFPTNEKKPEQQKTS